MESLGFSMYSIMSSVSNEFYFFAVWMSFNPLSCLIAVAMISSAVLNKSGKNVRPYLV